MEHSEQINEIAAALCKAQAEFPVIQKGRTARIPTKAGGEFEYQYADLGEIIQAVKPVLGAHGLAFTQGIANTPDKQGVEITTMLLHISGQFFKTNFYLAADTTGQKNALQSLGSSLTYGRKYSLVAILGITSEADDDGKAGGEGKRKAQGSRQAGAQGGTGKRMIVTAVQVPEEFWKHWKTDRAKARDILGGEGYGYKKPDNSKIWFITKSEGMSDPKIGTKPSSNGTQQAASGTKVNTVAPDTQRPSPDIPAKSEAYKAPNYKEMMSMVYKVTTREQADTTADLLDDCYRSKSITVDEYTKAQKTLEMIVRAKELGGPADGK